MSKHLFVVPNDVVPSEEQLKAMNIFSLHVINDLKPYTRPILLIKYSPKNNRYILDTKYESTYIIKESQIIKGKKKILDALKAMRDGRWI